MPLGDGSFGLLPEEWLKKYVTLAGVGTPEGDHLRFRRTQVGLLDVLLAEQPERDSTSDSSGRERLRQFQGMRPRTRRRVPGSAPRLSPRRPRLAPLPPGVRFRRLPGRRHGPGQDRPGTRPAGGRAASCGPPRKRRRPPPSLVVVPRSLVFNWKQEAARFTPKLRVLDHTGIGRGKPGTIRRLRRHPDHLRHASERHRRPQGLPLRLRHPRRGPGDQEREQPVGEGGPADPCGAPPGPQRHAGREPPRRVVEPVRVPQPGHARQGRGDRQGRRRPPQPRRGDRSLLAKALRPFLLRHQGAGREGPAREVRTDDLLRPGTPPAQAVRRARALPELLLAASRATGSGSRRSRSSSAAACGRRPATPA